MRNPNACGRDWAWILAFLMIFWVSVIWLMKDTVLWLFGMR